ncbi:MAG: conjugal transfer protein TrbE, partial [Planctomycetota bacterium]
LHFEARRVHVADYPDSDFPDPVSFTIDEERRRGYSAIDTHYETQHFISFTYLPPTDRVASVRKLLIEGDDRDDSADYSSELRQYKNTVETTMDLLAQTLLHVEILAGDELLTYLHSTVTDHPIDVQMPEVPMHLDCLLSNARFVGGLAPRLGKLHLATIGVRSWPNTTTPAMLDRLHSLGIPYRWVVRWMPYSREDAQKKLGRIRQLWFGKRKTLQTLLKEAIAKKESGEVDQEAVAKYDDADAAYAGLGEDIYAYGHFTLTITTHGESADQAASRARQIRQVIDGLGLVSVVETVNAVDAWLGSLPGQVYADARRPLLHSLNLCDMMPISSVWAGDAECEHLRGPALLTAAARGATPFRLNLWDGDVGHTMILGPTGAGKSTLLATLAAQFRRYPGAQVYFFDVGRSSRALTKAVGGEFHDLGAAGGLDFQPLRLIDQESERIWARDWLVELCRLAGCEPDTAQTNAIADALEAVARIGKPEQRTLSVLRGLLQDRDIKEALSVYTASGMFGTLLDADHDTLNYADWQAFEMEAMLGSPGQLTPVLLYIFHVLERRFAAPGSSGNPE